MLFMPTIRATDLVEWREQARRWHRRRPGRDPLSIELAVRRLDLKARCAFYIAALDRGIQAEIPGFEACCVCGYPTHSWCEGCYARVLREPSFSFSAVCQACDTAQWVCDLCDRAEVRGERPITPPRRQSRSPRRRRRRRRRSRSPDGVMLPAASQGSQRQASPSPRLPQQQASPLKRSGDSSLSILPDQSDRVLEPALRALVCDKPERFVRWLVATGIETCMDLRAVWGSGQRLVAEFEDAHGRLDAEEAFNLALVYTLAAKQAKEHQLNVVKTVVMDRQSSQPSHPTLTLRFVILRGAESDSYRFCRSSPSPGYMCPT